MSVGAPANCDRIAADGLANGGQTRKNNDDKRAEIKRTPTIALFLVAYCKISPIYIYIYIGVLFWVSPLYVCNARLGGASMLRSQC